MGSAIKLILPWNSHLFIFFRSPFKFFADNVISWTTKKWEVSSVNSLGFEIKLSERSVIYIKKNWGPKTDLWRTPALTFAREEYWPFKTTLKNQLLNWISHHLLHFVLIYKWIHCAKLYQMLLIYQGKHLWLQIHHQRIYSFHE